jgi:hypothetical protein
MNQADTLRVRKSTFLTHIIAGRFQVAAKKSGGTTDRVVPHVA